MLYFSYNDFIDCTENGEINAITKLEEEVETYKIKNTPKIANKNKITEILEDKIQMQKFLKEFLNFYQIIDIQNLTYCNNLKEINVKKYNKIIYKIEDKEIFIFIKVIEEIDYNISYNMFEDSLKIIQIWDTEEKKKNKRNPIVVPVVIYLGEKLWENRKIHNKLNYMTITENRINFSYNIININDIEFEELKKIDCKVANEMLEYKDKYSQTNK